MAALIREACLNDCTAICTLSRDQLGYDFPPEEVRKKLSALLNSPTDKIFVAEMNEQVIGYIHACGYDVLYAPHMKNILGIAVAEAYQKCGIGRMLLTAVEHWAAESGAAGIRLTSGKSRTGAHTFYQECGYTRIKEQVKFRKMIK